MIDSTQSSFIIPKYLPGPSKVRCCTKSSWVFLSMGGVSPYFHRTSVQEASSDRAWGVSPDSGGNSQVPSTHPSLGGEITWNHHSSVRMLCAQPCGWSQAPQELFFFFEKPWTHPEENGRWNRVEQKRNMKQCQSSPKSFRKTHDLMDILKLSQETSCNVINGIHEF